MFEHYVTNRFLATLGAVEHGSITITTPDGKTHVFGGPKDGAHAELVINNWKFINAILRAGDIALAETYRDGWWDSADLTQLFLFGLQNRATLEHYIQGSIFGRAAARLAYLFTRNSLQGSRKNIHAHYDLGNDFYKLWLDPTMSYSAAIYANDTEKLETAQLRKYDRMIERINPSGSLLEIGCGWGGFAERAVDKGDYQIKALTISEAQHGYARERLGNKAHIALEDYRHQTGRYDQIVSIEMFEAVGEQYWATYFSKLKSLLADKGKAMIQTITISDSFFESYRKSGDAIRTFIFPGGMLPSPSRFREESLKAGLRPNDEFSFGQDYARTLMVWLDNFDARIAEVKAMGFDEKFIRMWRFYLTYCIGAFRHGQIDVMQWELSHAH
jgi:cyclopropane-fatty-acyl-phospholipid synthase